MKTIFITIFSLLFSIGCTSEKKAVEKSELDFLVSDEDFYEYVEYFDFDKVQEGDTSSDPDNSDDQESPDSADYNCCDPETGDYDGLFANPAIEDWIRMRFEIPEDEPITEEMLLDIPFLSFKGSDLRGVEKMKNLTSITISSDSICDYSPLKDLKELERMVLSNYKDETFMTCLDDSISKLDQVKELVLHGGIKIKDIAPVGGMAGLESIELEDTWVDHIPDSFVKLENLEYFSSMDSRNLSGSLSPFGGLKKLKTINCQECGITDLSGLENMESIELINLSFPVAGFKLHSIESLKNLDTLRALFIPRAGLTELPVDMSGMTSLETIDISHNEITDISSLAECSNLIELEASANKLTSLPVNLKKLKNLQKFYVSFSDINDISAFEDKEFLNNVAYISLAYNLIENVAPLAGRYDLHDLQMRNNCVTDFSVLEDLRAHGVIINGVSPDSRNERCP
ncbi:MAG: hypothetical protein R6W70_05795 [bacterium]